MVEKGGWRGVGGELGRGWSWGGSGEGQDAYTVYINCLSKIISLVAVISDISSEFYPLSTRNPDLELFSLGTDPALLCSNFNQLSTRNPDLELFLLVYGSGPFVFYSNIREKYSVGICCMKEIMYGYVFTFHIIISLNIVTNCNEKS